MVKHTHRDDPCVGGFLTTTRLLQFISSATCCHCTVWMCILYTHPLTYGGDSVRALHLSTPKVDRPKVE